MTFLFLGTAHFQQFEQMVFGEEFFQRTLDFHLFILADLCYACHGKSLLGKSNYFFQACLQQNMKLSRSLLQNNRKRFDILETLLTRVSENCILLSNMYRSIYTSVK